MFTNVKVVTVSLLSRVQSRVKILRCVCTTSVNCRKSTIKKIKEQISDETDLDDPQLDTANLMARLRGGLVDHGENVFIIQPDYKWGKDRHLTKVVKPRLEEAIGLVDSINKWKVGGTAFASVHEHNPTVFFGTGKVAELGKEIQELKKTKKVTSVFLNTGVLTNKQLRSLEDVWRCKVFDRYRVVLEIFKSRASTKEAKLQVKLAEVLYLKSHLTATEHGKYDHQGGIMSMAGKGETQHEKDRRTLAHIEEKVKKAIKHTKELRSQKRTNRMRLNFPVVALIGYTNAGKTSLARGLARDFSLVPEDRLFATLDTTVHRSNLPSRLPVLFLDTVGFISELPHELVESFSATLEDVTKADVLVHVRDVTHPEFELQNETVLQVLKKLNLREGLIDNMIYADNKLDLSPKWSIYFSHKGEEKRNFPKYNTENVIGISATNYVGLLNLKYAIQKKIFEVLKKDITKVTVAPDGDELRWLHHEATVINTSMNEDGTFTVDVVTDPAILGKYKKKFGKEI